MADTDNQTERRFFGTFEVPVEDSGRLLLPIKWRLEAAAAWFGVILWPIGVQTHLLGFPPWRWDKFLKHLTDNPPKEELLAQCERVLGETSDEVDQDKIGRVTVRRDLLDKINVKKTCILLGRLTKWELWSPEQFQKIGKVSNENSDTASSHYKDVRP